MCHLLGNILNISSTAQVIYIIIWYVYTSTPILSHWKCESTVVILLFRLEFTPSIYYTYLHIQRLHKSAHRKKNSLLLAVMTEEPTSRTPGIKSPGSAVESLAVLKSNLTSRVVEVVCGQCSLTL